MEEYEENLKNDLTDNENMDDIRISYSDTKKRKKRTILKFAIPISDKNKRISTNSQ